MKHWQQWVCASALTLMMGAAPQSVQAAECGLSCCIAAGVYGVGSSTGLSLSLQSDQMWMKTIHQGQRSISPQGVIQQKLAAAANGSMYAAPTSMTMRKVTVNVSYRMNEQSALLLTIPYVSNDMTMQRGMKMMGGAIRYQDVVMNTVQGLGDISLIYLHDAWKDQDIRTRQRISWGVGLKAPTGASKARNSQGKLVHIQMQAGTGAWDAVMLLNGLWALGEFGDGGAQWFLAPSLMYQVTTRNALGYKVGNRLNYDVSTRYRLSETFNAKLDLNGVISQRDSSNGHKDVVTGLVAYQNPMSMLEQPQNTGGHSIFISPGFQWIVAPGYTISGEYRIPVYQRVNGQQIVTNQWMFIRGRVAF